MSYLCKDCVHNNHGWCKVLKRNKLKEIDKCAVKDDGSKKAELRPFEKLTSIPAPTYPGPSKTEQKEDNTEAYRVLGKREMLWNIQRQAIAIKEDNSIDASSKFEMLCHCINSIAQSQEYSEKIFKVEDIIDSEIDDMMIKDSKLINTRL